MTEFHKRYLGSRLMALFALLLFFTVNTGCGQSAEAFSFSEEEQILTEPDTVTVSVSQETEQTEEDSAQRLTVHICGAVQKPGVYELPEGSRIMDAVTAGGGFSEEAAQDACNLAAVVKDGSRIYILTEEERAQTQNDMMQSGILQEDAALVSGLPGDGEEGETLSASADNRVNLNTADAAALQTLPGIGESRAAAILAWRREHGRFERIEDIMKISGIKQAAFDKIKDRITV